MAGELNMSQIRFFAVSTCFAVVATMVPSLDPVAIAQATRVVTVTGVIEDAMTGAKVAGLNVELVGPYGPAGEQLPNTAARGAISDQEGRYVLADVAPGLYKHGGRAAGFASVIYGQANADSPGRDLIVGTVDVTVRLQAWRLPSVSGRVLDERGEAVTGAVVVALRRSARAGQFLWVNEGSANSDDSGAYRIGGLPAGTYAVAVIASTLSTFTEGVTSAPSDPGHSASHATLAPVVRVGNGLVRSTAGSAPVLAKAGSGEFDIYAISFHPAAISLDLASTFVLAYGDSRAAVDINRQRSPAGSLTGVVGATDGASGLVARLLLRSRSRAPRQVEEVATTEVKSDGTFSFWALPPGQFDLVISPSAASPSPASALYAHQVASVEPKRVSRVELAARRGFTITGRIVPLDGVTIDPALWRRFLVGFEALTSFVHSEPVQFRVDAAGAFTMTTLPGRFQVNMGSPAPLVFAGARVGTGARMTELDLDESTSAVELLVAARPTEISGVVSAGRAEALASSVVYAFSSAQGVENAPVAHPRSFAEGAVNPNGAFRIAGLLPGEYLVVAVQGGLGKDWQSPEVLRKLRGLGKRVTLSAAGVATADLRLETVR